MAALGHSWTTARGLHGSARRRPAGSSSDRLAVSILGLLGLGSTGRPREGLPVVCRAHPQPAGGPCRADGGWRLLANAVCATNAICGCGCCAACSLGRTGQRRVSHVTFTIRGRRHPRLPGGVNVTESAKHTLRHKSEVSSWRKRGGREGSEPTHFSPPRSNSYISTLRNLPPLSSLLSSNG